MRAKSSRSASGPVAPAHGSRTAFRPTRTARMRCAGITYWFCGYWIRPQVDRTPADQQGRLVWTTPHALIRGGTSPLRGRVLIHWQQSSYDPPPKKSTDSTSRIPRGGNGRRKEGLMVTRRGGRGVADGASGGFRTTSSSVRSNKKTRFLSLGYHVQIGSITILPRPYYGYLLFGSGLAIVPVAQSLYMKLRHVVSI